jgi:hypothetical protein
MRISICGHTFQIRETACTQDSKLPKLLSGTVHIMRISRAHLSTLMSLCIGNQIGMHNYSVLPHIY